MKIKLCLANNIVFTGDLESNSRALRVRYPATVNRFQMRYPPQSEDLNLNAQNNATANNRKDKGERNRNT